MEYSNIDLKFDNNFTLKDLPDKCIARMLEYVIN